MMTKKFLGVIVNTLALLSLAITGCSGSGNTETETKSTTKSKNSGTLTLVANGEDFVRQGFVTKDNWQVSFERVAVNLGNAISPSAGAARSPLWVM